MISVRLVQETDALIRRVESVQHAKAGYYHEITRLAKMSDGATKLAMREESTAGGLLGPGF